MEPEKPDPDLSKIGFGTNRCFLIITLFLQLVNTVSLAGVQLDAIWRLTFGDLNVKLPKADVGHKINCSCPESNETHAEPNKATIESFIQFKVEYGNHRLIYDYDPSNMTSQVKFITIQCIGITFCLMHAMMLGYLLRTQWTAGLNRKLWQRCTSYLKIVTVVSLLVTVTKAAYLSILVDLGAEFLILNEVILLLTETRYQELLRQTRGGVGFEAGFDSTALPALDPRHDRSTKLGISWNTCWLVSFVIVQTVAAFLMRFFRSITQKEGYSIIGIPVFAVFSLIHIYFSHLPLRAYRSKNLRVTRDLLILWSRYLKITSVAVVIFFCHVLTGSKEKVILLYILEQRRVREDDTEDQVMIILTKSAIQFWFLNGIILLMTKNLYREIIVTMKDGQVSEAGGGQWNMRKRQLLDPGHVAAVAVTSGDADDSQQRLALDEDACGQTATNEVGQGEDAENEPLHQEQRISSMSRERFVDVADASRDQSDVLVSEVEEEGEEHKVPRTSKVQRRSLRCTAL